MQRPQGHVCSDTARWGAALHQNGRRHLVHPTSWLHLKKNGVIRRDRPALVCSGLNNPSRNHYSEWVAERSGSFSGLFSLYLTIVSEKEYILRSVLTGLFCDYFVILSRYVQRDHTWQGLPFADPVLLSAQVCSIRAGVPFILGLLCIRRQPQGFVEL